MGSQSSNTYKYEYSVEAQPSESENETGIRRCVYSPNQLISRIPEYKMETSWDLFQLGKSKNPNNRFLGKRKKLGDKLGPYEWLTYAEVEELAISLGSALCDIIVHTQFPDEMYTYAKRMQTLGIFSKNCVEWFICEQAANAFNLSLVPFYESLNSAAIMYIFEATKLTVVAGTINICEMLLKIPEVAALLKAFISFDDAIPENIASLAKELKISILLFSNLVKTPKKPPCPGTKESVSTICYTSGTTGNPKGVILTQDNIVSTVCGCLSAQAKPLAENFLLSEKDCYLSYLPAAHVFERAIANLIISKGGSIGLYSGDVLKLMDDVQALKPTVFISVPRLFNRIHDRIFEGIKHKSLLARRLFYAGVSAKLKLLRTEGVLLHKFWDNLVFNKVKQLMGGELRYFVVGGAPLNSSVQEKISVLFSTPICQGYGLTETFGTSLIGKPKDLSSGHVGGPNAALEYKLRSVPDLGYSVKDEFPRGEVLLRGPGVTKGFFRNPELTKEFIDSDGWFMTGDIVILLPNGALRLIDRKKNIFKLSQGEYITPELVESVYSQSVYIAQIIVHGSSEKNSLVAIIVVNEEAGDNWASKNNLTSAKLADLCKNPKFHDVVKKDMDAIAKAAKLKGFEKVKAMLLIAEPFSEDNGFVSPTQKLKRHVIVKHFAKELEGLYASLD